MYAVTIPENLYRALERQAKIAHRSVDDIVEQTLTRHMPAPVTVEDDLPPLLQMELRAMEQLSDTALWSLARSVMPAGDRAELSQLNLAAKERSLTTAERQRQETLLAIYNETTLRRAHAAVLLQARGHDMSDPAVLQSV
jgi:hypothetical protein